jgi:molecular chaperone GrpE
MSDPKPHADKDAQREGDAGSLADRPLEEQLADSQGRLQEQREAWLRALADADNARKRAQHEIAQARKYGVERLAEDLFPVMDSLEAALGAGADSAQSLHTGVELTLRQLRAALEKAGVTEVNAEPGQRFDPNRHQAMAAVESRQEPNTVVTLLQKGYALHDRVVRPALVTVARSEAVENGPTNPISDSNLESN